MLESLVPNPQPPPPPPREFLELKPSERFDPFHLARSFQSPDDVDAPLFSVQFSSEIWLALACRADCLICLWPVAHTTYCVRCLGLTFYGVSITPAWLITDREHLIRSWHVLEVVDPYESLPSPGAASPLSTPPPCSKFFSMVSDAFVASGMQGCFPRIERSTRG